MSDIYTLFEEQTNKNANKTAIEYKRESISYFDLHKRVAYISCMIYKKGVRKNDIVVVYMSNSIETVSSMLAIQKIGAVCLPVDVKTPIKRIEMILSISKAKLVLYDNIAPTVLNTDSIKVSHDIKNVLYFNNIDIETHIQGNDNAFCIFTSGSTGYPKGVLIKQRGIINHIKSKIALLNLTEDSILCQSFSIGFVATIWQILTPLIIGAKLILYDNYQVENIYHFFETIEDDKVNVVSVIPQTLKLLLNSFETKKKLDIKNLKFIILTGSQLTADIVNHFYKLYDNLKLVNTYGQSECSDDILYYEIPFATDYTTIPIGLPIDNVYVDVRDENNNLLSSGEIGELCVRGICLATGYLDQAVTENKFIQDPQNKGEIVYKTGDVVRQRNDGLFEFIGRIDNQIKLRGHRIELEEIENIIEQYDSVIKSCVVLHEDEKDNQYLVGLFTSAQTVSICDLKNYVLSVLPAHMCPSRFIRIPEFEYTTNGKIDKKLIISKFLKNRYDVTLISEISIFDEQIINIIKKYIPPSFLKNLQLESEFMDIGVDSLNYFKMVLEIEKEFNIEFESQQINFTAFKYVSDMLNYIKGKVN